MKLNQKLPVRLFWTFLIGAILVAYVIIFSQPPFISIFKRLLLGKLYKNPLKVDLKSSELSQAKQYLFKFAHYCRKSSEESIILLRNSDNILPFTKDDTISVFGTPQIQYVRTGTGSGGMVNSLYTTDIIHNLESKGIKINKQLLKIYEKWCQDHPVQEGYKAWAFDKPYHEDLPISDSFAKSQSKKSNKALYLIGRAFGEGKDAAEEPGGYYLTDQEKSNIKNIVDAFENVVIGFDSTNILDMSWIDDPIYKGRIKGILLLWPGGIEGGQAVANVLSGKVTPSGKLPDTIAKQVSFYPSSKNFGHGGDVFYQEDIYVGYRYFETFAPDKVRYEFGFGLSYTTFSIEKMSAKVVNNVIQIEIKVTNTGTQYSGKEVVQLYFEAPQGKLGKPLRQLCAFEKTNTLTPNENQILNFEININDMASYDDMNLTGYKSCYVLEPGNYQIYAGNSVKNVSLVYEYQLDSVIVTKKLSPAMSPDNKQLTILHPKKNEDGTYSETYINSEESTINIAQRILSDLPPTLNITGDKGIKLKDVYEGNATLESFIQQLSVDDLSQLVRAEGWSSPYAIRGTASVFGGLSNSSNYFGIPIAATADGPNGLHIAEKTMMMPIETGIAATWNKNLIKNLFYNEGLELQYYKIDTLLGPGLNIHRHPLCGRNFEYYSEDPYLSGMMTIATTAGLKEAGVWGTIKHFALNNQETERTEMNSVCSERAIREIYLKAFEMTIKENTVISVMTSYNIINEHYAASNYDLVTTILRNEWGYKGLVMTDWSAHMNDVIQGGSSTSSRTRTADMIRSQNDLYNVVRNFHAAYNIFGDDTLEAVKEGRLTIGELQRAAMNICNMLMNCSTMKRGMQKLIDIHTVDPLKSAPSEKVDILQTNVKLPISPSQFLLLEVPADDVYTVIPEFSNGKFATDQKDTVTFTINDQKIEYSKDLYLYLQAGVYRIGVESSEKQIRSIRFLSSAER